VQDLPTEKNYRCQQSRASLPLITPVATLAGHEREAEAPVVQIPFEHRNRLTISASILLYLQVTPYSLTLYANKTGKIIAIEYGWPEALLSSKPGIGQPAYLDYGISSWR